MSNVFDKHRPKADATQRAVAGIDAMAEERQRDRGAAERAVSTAPGTSRLQPPRRPGGVLAAPGLRPGVGLPGQAGADNSRKLVVGREISLSGEIKACEKLVVEGRVEADLRDCRMLQLSESGLFRGGAVVRQADISGRFEGDLTVTGLLTLQATGHISGAVRYGEIEIARGGKIAGTVEETGGEAKTETASDAAAEHA